jgi:hypothetical protein
MPSVADPKRVGVSPRSDSSCSTNADDDIDSAAAMTTASSRERMDTSEGGAPQTASRNLVPSEDPAGSAKPTNTRPVMRTWGGRRGGGVRASAGWA